MEDLQKLSDDELKAGAAFACPGSEIRAYLIEIIRRWEETEEELAICGDEAREASERSDR